MIGSISESKIELVIVFIISGMSWDCFHLKHRNFPLVS